MRREILFYIVANILMYSLKEDNWIFICIIHLISYDITQHGAFGNICCAFISERKWKEKYHLTFTTKIDFTFWTTCKHLRGLLPFYWLQLRTHCTRFLTEVYNFIHYVVFKFLMKPWIFFLQKMNIKCANVLPISLVVSWIPCAIGWMFVSPQILTLKPISPMW